MGLAPSLWADTETSTPVPVTVATLQTLLLHPQRSGTARVVPLADAPLGVQVPGLVQEVMVEVGQSVAAGAVLLRLDDWEYRQALRETETALAGARQRLEVAVRQWGRVEDLRQSGQASAERADQRRAEQLALEAERDRLAVMLEGARERLQRTQVRAPFAGVILSRMVHPGQWAQPGEPLLRLIDPGRIELEARIDEVTAAHLTDIRSWRFDHGLATWHATPRALLPLEHAEDRMRPLRLQLQTADRWPPPEAVGRLLWESSLPHLPPWLPVRRGTQWGVFTLEAGKARFLPLPGDPAEGTSIPFAGDPAQQVIVQGRQGLNDGDPVAVVSPTE
ncbi:MAG: efflux RND transporter periplasmic adaptor subunit [Magnetococcus sp. WYHC-3]